MRNLAHIGIPSLTKSEDMERIESMKLWVSNPLNSKNGIERLFFESDCTMPQLLKSSAHIAYFVDDIEKELIKAEILVPLTALPNGVKLAFVVEESIPVELLQKP